MLADNLKVLKGLGAQKNVYLYRPSFRRTPRRKCPRADVSVDRISCGTGRDTVITDGKGLIHGVQALEQAADASIERTCENIQIND